MWVVHGVYSWLSFGKLNNLNLFKDLLLMMKMTMSPSPSSFYPTTLRRLRSLPWWPGRALHPTSSSSLSKTSLVWRTCGRAFSPVRTASTPSPTGSGNNRRRPPTQTNRPSQILKKTRSRFRFPVYPPLKDPLQLKTKIIRN